MSNSKNKIRILGISCFYHDSAACLIEDGNIISAVQEERFSRIKHDASFPKNAINFCLTNSKINLEDIDHVVYYEKPLLTFERLLETYLSVAPRGSRSFIAAMQIWLKEKLFCKFEIKKNLKQLQKDLKGENCKLKVSSLLFSEHHRSHAASAFYPSPFEEAIILCMDGVGEWATTSAWIGKGNSISPLWQIDFPHSLGLLYSAFTYFCGFKVNSGEYKLMGLAPYGEPIYYQKIRDNIIDMDDDGNYKLDMSFFKFHRGFRMTSNKFNKLFGTSPRKPESELTQFHMDLAASIQKITEEVVISIAKNLRKETGINKLCLAGGVALNCVANGKLVEKGIFDDIWIQPASGDAGTALGAGLLAWYKQYNKKRIIQKPDSMKGTYLGPFYRNSDIKEYLESIKAKYNFFNDSDLFELVANYLVKGKVIGWFNGPMEFGPRALGARSIIGDPRNKKMQSIMNLKIKYRESFRPFAPSILEEDLSDFFETNIKSPYMLLVSKVKKNLWLKPQKSDQNLFGIDLLNIPRSKIPAITHIDYSARIQTVNKFTNSRYYKLIEHFKKQTNYPIIVNTSFNVRGEPIVCSPEDAFRCFMRTEMDILVLENYILLKEDQKPIPENSSWKNEFKLD